MADIAARVLVSEIFNFFKYELIIYRWKALIMLIDNVLRTTILKSSHQKLSAKNLFTLNKFYEKATCLTYFKSKDLQ